MNPINGFIVPTHKVGGGNIYSNGFFVQSFLTDRYNHRKEARVISVESSSSIKFEIKSFF